jgi:putative spermidine/putrescine transport system ATP-binding protein
MTVRPEKITLLTAGEPEPSGTHVEPGQIRDIIYAGVLTRYVVDLDAGGELVVSHQNAEIPTLPRDPHDGQADAAETGRIARGGRVRIAWRADQAFTIPQGPAQGPSSGEDQQ